MPESAIGSLISGALAVLGSFVGNYAVSVKKSHEAAIKDAEREQAQKDQLNSILAEQKKIKERLDEHNHYAEKFADTSKELAVMNERYSTMQKDIEYLKSDRCKV